MSHLTRSSRVVSGGGRMEVEVVRDKTGAYGGGVCSVGGGVLDAYLAYVASVKGSGSGATVGTLASFMGLPCGGGDDDSVRRVCFGDTRGGDCDVAPEPSVEVLGVCGVDVGGDVEVVDSIGGIGGGDEEPEVASRGKHAAANARKRAKAKQVKAELKVKTATLEWRNKDGVGRGSCVSSVSTAPSLAPTVATVTTEVAEELEARRTLALRRVAENKVAAKMAELRLVGLCDSDKTAALGKLELARIQERINTANARSQASYKKCDSPLDSVGSAGSAGEFAWKQEIRKRDAIVIERDYLRVQLDEMLKTATPEMKRAVAAIPEPYIPTDAEIEAMDEDIAPYMSQAEMEADTERYFSRTDIFFER